jgi:hypothetical protein
MDELVKNVINLNNLDGQLSERVYSKFAGQVRKALLSLYFSGFDIPMSLMGSKGQIDSFMKALSGEKRYMDSYMKHGLGDQRTLDSQYKLGRATKAFESETGLRWPFKN